MRRRPGGRGLALGVRSGSKKKRKKEEDGGVQGVLVLLLQMVLLLRGAGKPDARGAGEAGAGGRAGLLLRDRERRRRRWGRAEPGPQVAACAGGHRIPGSGTICPASRAQVWSPILITPPRNPRESRPASVNPVGFVCFFKFPSERS